MDSLSVAHSHFTLDGEQPVILIPRDKRKYIFLGPDTLSRVFTFPVKNTQKKDLKILDVGFLRFISDLTEVETTQNGETAPD